MSYDEAPWVLLWWSVAIAISLMLMLVVYSAFMSVVTDGRVDYCYVDCQRYGDCNAGRVSLRAHRPWNTDGTLGMFSSTMDAFAAAEKIGCTIVEK